MYSQSRLRYFCYLSWLVLLLCFSGSVPHRQAAGAAGAVQCPPFSFMPNALPEATVGVAYSQTISAVGGQTPFTYTLASGSLPAGMIFGSNGRLGGTPTVTGNYNFTVRVTDANNCTATRAYALSVQCPSILILPATLPSATLGVAYSRTFTAPGGKAPIIFSIASGSLPPGFLLSSTGAFGGTSNTTGSYNFTIRATDDYGCVETRAYTLNVNCPDITLTPATLADGRVGLPYSQTLMAAGGAAPYNYSLLLGSLPTGLSLQSNGVITGSPSAAGSFSFTVRVRDANNCFANRVYTIVVASSCAPITLNPGTMQNATTGIAYSRTVTATGGQAPYTYVIVAGTLPAGLTLSRTTGEVSGTPTATAETASFTLRAVDSNGCDGQRMYSIQVACPTITINPASLPDGRVDITYSQAFSATGGTSPYRFGTQASALPPGLSLNLNGTLSGKPTAAGSYSFIIRGNDANGCFGERSYTLVIHSACPTITINTPLQAGFVGTAYSRTFSATGGTSPYTFSTQASALPPGLSLMNGTLSGRPTTVGSYSFIIRGTDANGCFGERSYTLVINPACPTITINPATLPAGTLGMPYSQTLSTTGGTAPYSYDWLPMLPSGLSLNTDGRLSGTPTAAGSYTFRVGVRDANSCVVERDYTVVINSTCLTITINPPAILSGRVGQAYSWSFNATGGATPYTYSITSGLPAGLTFTAPNSITGTPTAAGDYTVMARAVDANGCVATRDYALTIRNPECPAVTVNPTSLPAGTLGTAYNQTITATGGTAPHTFGVSSGALPAGLTLSSSGALSGTPMTAGNYSFFVRATSANGCSGERNYTLAITGGTTCATLMITPASLPAGTVNTPFNQTLAAMGGTAPYSFTVSAGSLPAGISLNSSTGALTGTPTAAATVNLTVRANDGSGCTGERDYTLMIGNALVVSVSAASYAPSVPLAMESIVAAFGVNMATTTQTATTVPLPTELAGVSVRVTDSLGVERSAPLFFVSPGQINYQLPPATAMGAARVTVLNGAAPLSSSTVNVMAVGTLDVASVRAGLFAANANGAGAAAAVVLRISASGAQSYESVARYDTAQNRFVTTAIDLGSASDQLFLVLYGTGLRFRSSLATVSCVIGGVTSDVLYAGEAPGFTGLDQVNVRLPRSLAGRGEVDVALTVEGNFANTVRIAVR